eukprot:scaffold6847_cov64-Phaeocystis_antarctica.AAC.13
MHVRTGAHGPHDDLTLQAGPLVRLHIPNPTPAPNQAGPLVRLHIPIDHATGGQRKFAFAEYTEAASARSSRAQARAPPRNRAQNATRTRASTPALALLNDPSGTRWRSSRVSRCRGPLAMWNACASASPQATPELLMLYYPLVVS